MKKMKRNLTLILAAVLFISLFNGCLLPGAGGLSSPFGGLLENTDDPEPTPAVEEQTLDESTPAEEPTPTTNIIQNFFQTLLATEPPEGTPAPVGDTIINNYIYDSNSTVYSESTSIRNSTATTTTTTTTTINNVTVINVPEVNNTVIIGGDKQEGGTLGGLAADEVFLLARQVVTITFMVEAKDIDGEIDLCCGADAAVAAVMHDDGEDGDDYAGDGVYTAVINDAFSAGNILFWAQAGNVTSTNSVRLYFFEQPTAESAAAAERDITRIRSDLIDIEQSFADANGFVPAGRVSEALRDIAAYLDEAVEDGSVLLYEAGDDSVYLKLPSGIGMAYTVAQEETDSVGSGVAMTVISCQPTFTEMGGTGFSTNLISMPAGVSYYLGQIDAAAQKIDDRFDNYTFASATDYDDSEVTLSLIRSFGENEIVLWHGHGYFGLLVKSCLQTGEAFDWNAYLWDVGYFLDFVSDRLLYSAEGVIVSSGYIRKYCGNLNNSLFYLAACASGKDDGLAKAFLNKGAAAVVANTETIKRVYNVAMLYSTANYMTAVNPDTGNYYTLQEAINRSMRDHGSDDTRYGGVGAYPKVFGGTAAQNFRLGDAAEREVDTGSLTGRICRAADRSTPVDDAEIRVYDDDTLVAVAIADADGAFTVSLPEGSYRAHISADGYIPFDCYADVEADSNIYLEVFLMVQDSGEGEGTAQGVVTNAFTGEGIGGVELTIRSGWNNSGSGEVIGTVYTEENGLYSVELPLGNYTMTAFKDGFIGTSFNIVVQAGVTDEQNASISPVVSGDDYRIVLTWGRTPTDLDSHAVGALLDGSFYHVFFMNKSFRYEGTEICNLDVDDITSYGPETVTLTTEYGEPVYYYVHRYSSDSSLAVSEAQVKVYQGDTLIRVFNVPTDLGEGRFWNVFAIVDGGLVIRNTITSEPETGYAVPYQPENDPDLAADEIIMVDEPEPTAESEPEPDDEPERTDESEPEPAEEPERTDESEPERDTEPEPTTESEPEPAEEPEPTAESEPEPDNDPEPTDESEREPDDEPEPTAESKPELAEEPEPTAEKEPEPDEEPEPTAKPEEHTASDPYESLEPEIRRAYDEMLDTWKEAAAATSGTEALNSERYQVIRESFPDVNTDMLLERQSSDFDLAYAVLDIDGNRTPELLIGADDQSVSGTQSGIISARVISIFGYVAKSVRELDDDLRATYHTTMTLYEDGWIVVGRGSAVTLYRVDPDDFTAEECDLGELGLSDGITAREAAVWLKEQGVDELSYTWHLLPTDSVSASSTDAD